MGIVRTTLIGTLFTCASLQVGCDRAAAKVDEVTATIDKGNRNLGSKLQSEAGLIAIEASPDMEAEAQAAAKAMTAWKVKDPEPLEVCGAAWTPDTTSLFVERESGLLVQSIRIGISPCDALIDACIKELGEPTSSSPSTNGRSAHFEGKTLRLRIISVGGSRSLCTVLAQHREGIDRVEKRLAQ